jgi:hypothetical protein
MTEAEIPAMCLSKAIPACTEQLYMGVMCSDGPSSLQWAGQELGAYGSEGEDLVFVKRSARERWSRR